MTKRYLIIGSILLVLGLLCTGACVYLFVDGNSMIQKKVEQGCQLKEGTLVYDNWINSSVPMYISMYVFDLENPDQFLNGTEAPSLRQRGPFVYKEIRTKKQIQMYPNETISYSESRSYIFDRASSADDESVRVTTINLVYMTLVNYLQMEDVQNYYKKLFGDLIASIEQPLMNRTVKDLIWGYEDPLLKDLKDRFPKLFANDQVSIFNADVSDIGLNVFLINNGVGVNNETGQKRIEELGEIEKYNYRKNLTIWSDRYANMINGTDSTLWHPSTQVSERIYTFIPDICRSVYLDFSEKLQNNFDIGILRFTLPNSVFANSSDNHGFCLNTKRLTNKTDVQCLPSGLFSLSNCVRLGGSSVEIPLPIIASSPHFLGADASVRNAVKGLNPDDTRHRSFMDIEPRTGIVMNGSRRLQININVINVTEIAAVATIRRVVYPLMWINEHAEIDKPNADKFRSKVLLPIKLANVMTYVSLGLAIVLLISFGGLVVYRLRFPKESAPAFLPSRPDEISPLLS